MRRSAILVAFGFILLGIAFAAFPISEIVGEWSAQHANSTVKAIQLSCLVALGLAATALLLTGAASRFPFPPIGFLGSMVIAGAIIYLGVGMLLGG
jgi:hypothetical protein